MQVSLARFSSANQGRAGLDGRLSYLFLEFVRIRALFEKFFVSAMILIMGENVEEMPGDALRVITHALGGVSRLDLRLPLWMGAPASPVVAQLECGSLRRPVHHRREEPR